MTAPRDDSLGTRARARLAIGLRPDAIDEHGLPRIAVRAHGPWLIDARGRRFIDLVMGHGSLLLGHASDPIVEAIQQQAAGGTLCGWPHALEVEVAEQLRTLIPNTEMVAFGKNGSDVCLAAMRLARSVTGREGVLQFGYHGFHDWSAVVNPNATGVPSSLRQIVHTIEYGDVTGIEAIFANHGAEIAAVITEPFRTELPDPGFLHALRRLCTEHGALFVLDEMVTGFRIDRGGVQRKLGITPDLACYGKALAHGLPLAALCGSARLMADLAHTGYGMTARGDAIALAAAHAALDIYRDRDVAGTVRAIGAELQRGFDAMCREFGIDGSLIGDPAMMAFRLPSEFGGAFLRHLGVAGVASNGTVLPSTVHADVVDETLAAMRRALEASR